MFCFHLLRQENTRLGEMPHTGGGHFFQAGPRLLLTRHFILLFASSQACENWSGRDAENRRKGHLLWADTRLLLTRFYSHLLRPENTGVGEMPNTRGGISFGQAPDYY